MKRFRSWLDSVNLLWLAAPFLIAGLMLCTPGGWDVISKAQQNFRLPSGTVRDNHQLVSGLAPTTTNGTMVAGSTDMSGADTITAGDTAVMTFATAWTVTPFCVVTDGTTAEPLKAVVTTTTLTISGVSGQNNDRVSYVCYGTVYN
jgi:hypothetical protein